MNNSEQSLAKWIWRHVSDDLDDKRNAQQSEPITESTIEHCFLNWFAMSKLHSDYADTLVEDPDVFIHGLINEYEEKESFDKPVGFGYSDNDNLPWVNQEKPNIEWFYWERYRKYLVRTKQWSANTVRSMDKDTDNILDGLANPKTTDPFDKRGLVVAAVQSGKTANYIGLMAKAADAGYKIIIVMAGIYNVLRNQTQERIEDGFIGYDLVSKKYVGVGTHGSRRRPYLGTSRNRDFNKVTEDTSRGLTSGQIREPLVFVIKKNTNSLHQISLWLENNCKNDGPLLLIDDEADNASINVKYGKGEISKINGQIRGILNLFSQSAYVGYTATPFANVLIDAKITDEEIGDDIFPRNFIYTLEQSSAYFGADKVFKDINEPKPKYVHRITDDDESNGIKRRNGDTLETLPESLEQAIATFIVACAIRVLSGNANEHMTMMVNMSPYKTVQHSIAYLIEDHIDSVRNSIMAFASLPSMFKLNESQTLRELKATFDKDYAADTNFTWDDILGVLQETIRPMTVAEINSQSNDVLDYTKTPQRIIAVGGYRLSRGLTLEGLVVSYYARNAKAYDSLMQMARWFGYRFGYENLCRIWLTDNSAQWYAYVADATKEFTDEVRAMWTSRSTPRDYALRIKSSVDTLMITARNKMGAGKEIGSPTVKLDGAFIETTAFDRNPEILQANEQLCLDFLSNLQKQQHLPDSNYSTSHGRPNGKLIRNIPSIYIRDFVSKYNNSSQSPKSQSEYLLNHISLLDERGHDKWDVFIASGKSSETSAMFSAFDVVMPRERRTPGLNSNNETLFSSQRRLSSRGVEIVPLNDQQINQAVNNFRKDHPDKKNVSDIYYRRIPGRSPLLILHPLAFQFKDEKKYQQWLDSKHDSNSATWPSVDHVEITIGWSISFPEVGIKEQVPYVYNSVVRNQIISDLDDEGVDDDEPDV